MQVDNENNALHTDMENGFMSGDKDKRWKKKRHDVSYDNVGFSDVQDTNLEGNIQNNGIEMEKNQGKKKREERMNKQKFVEARQKDLRSDTGGAFNKVEEALKETDNHPINVRKNDRRDSRSSVELEAGKERKKKHRETKNKDRIRTTSTMIDDLESERTEKTMGQKIHDKEEIPKVNTDEEANLKKN